MKKINYPMLLLSAIILVAVVGATSCGLHRKRCKNAEAARVQKFRKKIKHIVVIYEENWSFDGLFGDFPGANNLLQAKDVKQYDKDGKLIDYVPQPYSSTYGTFVTDQRFNGVKLLAEPYDLLKYIKTPSAETGDLKHLFYNEQIQIDGGKMDKFVAYSDNGGLTMSYINLHNELHLLDTLEWKMARQYTLCDNFFHSAFGGSFLNHIWFVSASSPDWDNAPASLICRPEIDSLRDRKVTQDGYVVNTSYSINTPHPANIPDSMLVPYQNKPTIGDRLMDAGISWAWYSGQWDSAVLKDGKDADFNRIFQYHHEPFLYFSRFKEDSVKKKYLKDEKHFFEALSSDNLPSVSFIKPFGTENQHPGYSDLWTGMVHAQKLVDSIMHSQYWDETVIIITSDENGGRWDHVAPPQIDRWGPGTRIPAVIISPYAKKGYIDHTQYETVSILKLIETRYGLKPLTLRDANANDMLNAFDF